ncbi:MAG TPA: hypothetical protein VGW96_01095 [Candidatus Eremiobacteraceae bacterium]|nr:hypothetical protein [Candidatus Eremiobacteraceae bacterium]
MVSLSKKSKQLIVAAGLALGVFALGACSGGGGSISSPVAQPNQPSMPAGQWSGSLAQAGMSVNLPSVVGFHETMTFPANNAAAGTTLTIKLSSAVPAGMPALDPDMHVVLPFFYFTLSSSKTVTLNGFPGFTLKAPAHFDYGNLPAKIGYYDPATGWKHIANMTYTSGVLTFTPTSTHTTLQANVIYYALPYTCGGPSPSPTPTGVISCTASGTGAIGVLCINSGSAAKTYAFAGKGLDHGKTTVEQLDISGGASGGGPGVVHTYTSGGANPVPYTACSADEKHLRVFCSSFSSGTLMDIDGNARSDTEFASGASGGLNISGTGTGGCVICAVAFDPMDTAFIVLDKDNAGTGCSAQCGQYQRIGENSHAVSMSVKTGNPNENPGYDYVKNWIFDPDYGSEGHLKIADFTNGKLFTSSNTVSMSDPDSACVDVATHVGVTANEFTPPDLVTIADLGTATESGSTLTVASGQTTLVHTGDQSLDDDACGADSVIHVVFYAGEFGTRRLGFALLPTTSSGTSISDWAFTTFPNTPDGFSWASAFDPHPIAAFNDPANCPDCGISVNQGATWMAVIDIFKLSKAPRASGDPHTVDPAYDLIANHVLAYYAI